MKKTNMDVPHDIKKICFDCYNGYNSAMYAVAMNLPFSLLSLRREAAAALTKLLLPSHEPLLKKVYSWADYEIKKARVKKKFENSVIMAYNNGISIDDAYQILRSTYGER